MNSSSYEDVALARGSILDMLSKYEAKYGGSPNGETLSARFSNLIEAAYNKTGRKVVVIIDEYDKPLTDNLNEPELYEEMQKLVADFYGALKPSDKYLRFMLLTGITKFSRVSIFSKLNQLIDISLLPEYATICGITEKELKSEFHLEIKAIAKSLRSTVKVAIETLAKAFNGYCFTVDDKGKLCPKVYNPFSLLHAMAEKVAWFGYEWFHSGVPVFLPPILAKEHFDLRKFDDGSIVLSRNNINDYRPGNDDVNPLLYQTGFLTIKAFDCNTGLDTLTFPNDEVRYSLLQLILTDYTKSAPDPLSLDVHNFWRDLETHDINGFMIRIKAFFGSIPYDTRGNDEPTLKIRLREHYYHSLFYALVTLIGQYCHAERHSSQGRADLIIEVADAVYCFEFKTDCTGTADEALAQIDEKGYLTPYGASGKKLYAIGAVFDDESHTLGEWKCR
jgi:hypothetical protein